MTLYADGRGTEAGNVTKAAVGILQGLGGAPIQEQILVERIQRLFPEFDQGAVRRTLTRIRYRKTYQGKVVRTVAGNYVWRGSANA